MRYKKPMVLDLSAQARTTGQGPLGCYSGDTPVGGLPGCGVGTNGLPFGQECDVGPNPQGGSQFTCYSGGAADAFCEAGSSGLEGDVCTTGPTNV